MKKEIWYGEMIHLEDPLMIIVNSISEIVKMNTEEAEDYALLRGHDSYVVPKEYEGKIVFSNKFFERFA
jgi:hypothetical protein